MLQNLLGLTFGGQGGHSKLLDEVSRSAGVGPGSTSEIFSNTMINKASVSGSEASDLQAGAALTAPAEALKLSPSLLDRLELAVGNLVDAFAASGIELPQAGSDLPPLDQLARMLDTLAGEEIGLQEFDSLEPEADLLAALREMVAQVLSLPLHNALAVPLAAAGNAAPATDPALSGQGAVSASAAGLSPALVGGGVRNILAAQPGLVETLRALRDQLSNVLAKGELAGGAGFGRAAGQVAQVASAAMKMDLPGMPLAGVADDASITNGPSILATRLQNQAAGVTAGLATASAFDAVQPASSATLASAEARLQEFVQQAQRSAASLQLAQTAVASGALAPPPATVAPAQAALQPGLLRSALLAPVQVGGNAVTAASASALLDAAGTPVTANQAPFLPLVAAAQPLAPSPMAATFNTDVALPLLHSQWGQQLAQRIGWLGGQGIKSAEIQLNPPELGPMQVRIDTAEQSARVVISVHSPVAREALEAQLPRLRDLFANQGMDLVDVDVNSGEYSERQAGEQAGESMAGHEGETGSAALAAGDQPGQVRAVDAPAEGDALGDGTPTLQNIVLRYAVDAYA